MTIAHRCLLLVSAMVAACGGSAEPSAAPLETASPTEASSASTAEPIASAAASAAVEPPVETMTPGDPRVAATLKGTLLGKPFDGGSACVVGGTEPGMGYLEIYDTKGDARKSCAVLVKDAGARKIGVSIPWKRGEKVDLALLKPKSKDEPALFVMERIDAKKVDRKDAPKDFKPTGTLEIVRLADKGGVARIKLSLATGKDKLEGEIDVEVNADIAAK